MKYKNIGTVAKTFHGVKIKPGEVGEVNGYINHESFIRVPDAGLNPPPKPKAELASAGTNPANANNNTNNTNKTKAEVSK